MDVTSVTNAVSAAVTDAVTESIPEGYVTVRELLYKGWLGLLAEKGEIPLWLWISAIVFCAVLGYLLGSINCAVVISKLKYGDDIRKHGSGNAGATNMSRTYGKSAGIATLLGDVLKTVAAVSVARFLCGDVIAYMTGMFCALGHAFPCYYGFRGGKCVAVTAAMALALDPVVFVIAFAVFALVLAGTKYVSLASISAALMYPLVLNNLMTIRYGHGDLRIVFALAVCVLIIFLHRENIKRLIDGKENKFSFKKNGGKRNSSEK